MNHFAVPQKLTQYCKSTISQYKIKIKLNKKRNLKRDQKNMNKLWPMDSLLQQVGPIFPIHEIWKLLQSTHARRPVRTSWHASPLPSDPFGPAWPLGPPWLVLFSSYGELSHDKCLLCCYKSLASTSISLSVNNARSPSSWGLPVDHILIVPE